MSRRALPLAAVVLLTLAVGPTPAVLGKDATSSGVVAAGTPWATPYHVRDSGRDGPTVMIVGGLHGDEPAGALAAGQVRHWRPARGRLVVLPRANVTALAARTRETPNVPRAQRDLNRNFPASAADEPAQGELAQAIWDLVVRTRPDWLIDLHESSGLHGVDPQRVGHTIIVCASKETERAADLMLEAINATLEKPQERFVRLASVTKTKLQHAAASHLGTRTMIVETTTKGRHRAVRARQHRIMLHRLLRHLAVLEPSIRVEDVTPPKEGVPETVVGLYDAGGIGGRGVDLLERQLGRDAGWPTTRICAEDIRQGALEQFDVVVFSGGSGGGQARALGAEGRAIVRRYVRDGGGYVGICAGAYLAAGSFSWGLGVLDAGTASPRWRRGRATLRLGLTARGRALLGEPDRTTAWVLYHNGPVYVPGGVEDLEDYEPLALYRTEVAENDTPVGVMVGSPAIVAGRCGRGRVVCFSPHPEQTRGLEHWVPRAVAWTAAPACAEVPAAAVGRPGGR